MYFNKETGYDGAPYKKKTEEAMCTELGPGKPYMQQLVEEAGKTVPTDIKEPSSDCSVAVAVLCQD